MSRQASGLNAEQQAEAEKLRAVGYLGGVRESSATRGVIRYDPELSHAGLNLYSSGHGPEAILMDMNGQRLHVLELAVRGSLSRPSPAANSRELRLLEEGSSLSQR